MRWLHRLGIARVVRATSSSTSKVDDVYVACKPWVPDWLAQRAADATTARCYPSGHKRAVLHRVRA